MKTTTRNVRWGREARLVHVPPLFFFAFSFEFRFQVNLKKIGSPRLRRSFTEISQKVKKHNSPSETRDPIGFSGRWCNFWKFGVFCWAKAIPS